MKPIFLILFLFVLQVSNAQLEQTIDSLKKVLEPWFESHAKTSSVNDTAVVNPMNEISYLYFKIGLCDSANRYSTLARTLSEQIGYKRGYAMALVRDGLCYDLEGDFPASLDHFQRALLIFEETRDTQRVGTTRSTMASTYLELGNYDEAAKQFHLAVALFDLTNDEGNLSNCYMNIALMHSLQKNYQESIAYSLKALPIKETMGDKHAVSIILGNLGASYCSLLDFETGMRYFEESMVMKVEIGDLNSIGASYCGLGGMYFNQQNFTKAIENFLEGYKIATELNSIKFLKISRFGLFRSYYHAHDTLAAERFAVELLDMHRESVSLNFQIFSEKEKELYLKTFQKEVQKFNSFALHAMFKDPAITATVYNTVLYYKGLLLKSSTAMRNAVMTSGDQHLVKSYEEWIVLKKEIAKVYATGKNTTMLEQAADSIERELVKKSASFSDFEKDQATTWKTIQAALQPHEAAIEFVHFTHDDDTVDFVIYCALVVKPGSPYPEMIKLFRKEQLTEILGNFQGNNLDYVNAIYGTQGDANTRLYDLVWKPLEPSLTNTKKVFISPSGLLHRISFAALANAENVYLCDRYTLHMLTSTRQVANPSAMQFSNDLHATLFGGIHYSTDSTTREIWDYLAGTASETKEISAWLSRKKISVDYLTGDNATEAQFKRLATHCDILHVATHGFFYPDPKEILPKMESPESEKGELKFRGNGFGYATFVENENPLMRSGLALAGANDVWSAASHDGEDGVLTAQEVAHIDMRTTQLVVLSACETGLGDIVGSEGVYGLQRAFKMAGVKFMVMSLWQVPDKETSEFMQLFYRNLIRLKDVHAAFQKTQQLMRKKYDPYYWAAFVLIE